MSPPPVCMRARGRAIRSVCLSRVTDGPVPVLLGQAKHLRVEPVEPDEVVRDIGPGDEESGSQVPQ